jgi:hypothetical protein
MGLEAKRSWGPSDQIGGSPIRLAGWFRTPLMGLEAKRSWGPSDQNGYPDDGEFGNGDVGAF